MPSHEENHEIIERLARLETEIQWVKDTVKRLERDVSKHRMELMMGVATVVLAQVILRLLLG